MRVCASLAFCAGAFEKEFARMDSEIVSVAPICSTAAKITTAPEATPAVLMVAAATVVKVSAGPATTAIISTGLIAAFAVIALMI